MHRSMDNLEYWGLVLSLNPVGEGCFVTYGKEKILALSKSYLAEISLFN